MRREMIIKGYRNVNRFAWWKAAEQVLEIIEALSNEP